MGRFDLLEGKKNGFHAAGSCENIESYTFDILDENVGTKAAILLKKDDILIGWLKVAGDNSFLSFVDNLPEILDLRNPASLNASFKYMVFRMTRDAVSQIFKRANINDLTIKSNDSKKWRIIDVDDILSDSGEEKLYLKEIRRIQSYTFNIIDKFINNPPDEFIVL